MTTRTNIENSEFNIENSKGKIAPPEFAQRKHDHPTFHYKRDPNF